LVALAGVMQTVRTFAREQGIANLKPRAGKPSHWDHRRRERQRLRLVATEHGVTYHQTLKYKIDLYSGAWLNRGWTQHAAFQETGWGAQLWAHGDSLRLNNFRSLNPLLFP